MVLIVVSWVVDQTGFEDADQTAEVLARDLVSRSGGIETSVAFVGLAAIAGFWFVASVHMRLTAQGPSVAGWAALGGGMTMVALFLAGSAIKSAELVGSLANDPQVSKTLWLLEEGFSDAVGPALLVFMLGVSVVSIDRGDPPRWLGWAGGIAAAVLVLNSALGVASLAILVSVWVLALAVTMTIRLAPDRGAHALKT